jgi:hypothetical protein
MREQQAADQLLREQAAAVSHSRACIGSPCLRRCVHGASIGEGTRGGGGQGGGGGCPGRGQGGGGGCQESGGGGEGAAAGGDQGESHGHRVEAPCSPGASDCPSAVWIRVRVKRMGLIIVSTG